MGKWLDQHLKAVGVETQLVDIGKQTVDGKELELPPIILGRIGNDPKKKTVLVYGHYDVQPVSVDLALLTVKVHNSRPSRQANQMVGRLSRSPSLFTAMVG